MDLYLFGTALSLNFVSFSMQFLRRHLKSHSDERSYKCPECDKTFKTIMHVHRHKETVHLKVRFNCEYCEMSYGRKDKLRMHVERVHNVSLLELVPFIVVHESPLADPNVLHLRDLSQIVFDGRPAAGTHGPPR